MSFLDIRCSFCGKHQKDVKKVVAGPNVFICNECVAIANKIMKETPDEPDDQPKPAAWPAPLKPPRR